MNDRKTSGRRSAMLNDVPTTKKRPQLTPEIQSRIGQQLRKIYDDMVSQGVPDRFVDLLDRLEGQDKVDPHNKSGERQNDSSRPNKPIHKHTDKESR